ncbi:MAG: ABC transporter permease [Candidatus Aenigmatarchaeota archaeon]
MIQNFAAIALTNIRHRRLRSFLTVFAVSIGIAAVISLISVSQGMQETIERQFQMLGTDKIIVMPGGRGLMGAFGLGAGKLTEHDVAIIERVPGVDGVEAMVYGMARFEFGGDVKYSYLIGMPTRADAAWVLGNLRVDGRYLKEGDRYKAVVGHYFLAGKFFEKDVRLGSRLKIQNQTFKVVGALQEIGNRMDDTQVYVPIDVARELLDRPKGVDFIYAKVRPGADPAAVADKIEDAMRDERDQRPGEEDFSVQTMTQLMETVGTVLGVIQLILVGIAAISLLVGGIGIMNTMYTAVLERTREIGVLKAIGARNSSIMAIFLLESGILGVIGGVLGMLLGFGLAAGVEMAAAEAGFPMLKVSVNPALALAGALFAFTVGCLSGLLPARRAAQLQPADALRYE